MQIEIVAIEALIPYARNARTHSDEQVTQIAGSIREFGFTNPVLIDGDGGIIAGHGRVMGARKLGMSEVPCIRLAHLSEAQRRAYIIADNKLALNAGWDDEMLALEFQDLQGMGFDLELTGFALGDISELLAELDATPEGNTDADETPPVQAEAISKMGDVWILGKHRVMCGDSTSIDAVETLMDGGLANQLITDPPYNVALGMNESPEDAKKRNRRTDGLTVMNDEMSDDDFRQFLRDAFISADSVMKDGAVFYIWHADSEGYNFRGACKDIGWKVRQCLIWKKSSFVMGRQDYHWKHEPCLYGWKEGSGHLWSADRKQTTILEFDKPSRNGVHPTMKPVELIEYQVLNNTKVQDVVLDMFGGGGSTLIACEKTARHARLMELYPKYVDVIVRRWQQYTGKQAVHSVTGKSFDETAAVNAE